LFLTLLLIKRELLPEIIRLKNYIRGKLSG